MIHPPEGRRQRNPAADTDAEARDGSGCIGAGGHCRIWVGRRILLSTLLGQGDGSRRAVAARTQRGSGVAAPIPEEAGGDAAEKAADGAAVNRVSRCVLLAIMPHSHLLVA